MHEDHVNIDPELQGMTSIVVSHMEATRRRREAYWAAMMGGYTPRYRATRREKIGWKVRDAREWLALRIAPWLDDWR